MNLEKTRLTTRSQSQKITCYMIPLLRKSTIGRFMETESRYLGMGWEARGALRVTWFLTEVMIMF